jgi:outer membrane scaffolding protein for murein synthesis (MipA/OmpV family)
MRLLIAALLCTLSSPCLAQGRPAAATPTGWNVTMGAAPVYSPVFQGSSDYGLSIFPDIRANYGDDFFASVPEGVGYNFINANGWKIGPLAKIRFGRDEASGGSPFLISGESNALQGLGNIGTAGEVGGFVQYAYDSLRTRLELRQGFGGHNGMLGDASVNYRGRFAQVVYSAGPRLTYASSDFTQTYFGINSVQSTRSGLAQYRPGSGLVSYGVGGSLTLPYTDKIALSLFTGYDRLGNTAADSPLVRNRGSANQFSAGLGIGYRFNVGN